MPDLAKLIAAHGSDLRLRQAIVTSTPAGGTCTIRFGDLASTTVDDDIPGVHYLASAEIANGDTVQVLQTGGALLIVGPAAVTPGRVSNLSVLDTTGGEDPLATAYMLQAGSSVVSSDGGGDAVITYPAAFSVATLWVVACQGDITGNELLVYPHVYTTTTFTVRLNHSITGAAWVSAGPFRINWMALGY